MKLEFCTHLHLWSIWKRKAQELDKGEISQVEVQKKLPQSVSVEVVGGWFPVRRRWQLERVSSSCGAQISGISGQGTSYIKIISPSWCQCQKPSPFRLQFYSFLSRHWAQAEMEPQRAESGKRKEKQAMQQTTVSLPERVSTEWMPLKGGLIVVVLAGKERKKSQLGG